MIKRLYMEDSGDFEQRGDRKRGYRRAPKGLSSNRPFNLNKSYMTMINGARGFNAKNKEGLKRLLALVDAIVDDWVNAVMRATGKELVGYLDSSGDNFYVTDDFTCAFDIYIDGKDYSPDMYDFARFLRKSIRTKFRAPGFGLEVSVEDPYEDDTDGYVTLVVRSTDAYYETEYEDDDYSDIRPKKPEYANESYRRRFRRR